METFSALLAVCAGNSPVPGEFPEQRPVTRSFDVFFNLHPNKRLSKQVWGRWFETLSCPLWRHRNVHVTTPSCLMYWKRTRYSSMLHKLSWSYKSLIESILFIYPAGFQNPPWKFRVPIGISANYIVRLRWPEQTVPLIWLIDRRSPQVPYYANVPCFLYYSPQFRQTFAMAFGTPAFAWSYLSFHSWKLKHIIIFTVCNLDICDLIFVFIPENIF